MPEEPRRTAKMAVRPDAEPPATPRYHVFDLSGETVLADASLEALEALMRVHGQPGRLAVVLENEALLFATGYQARCDGRRLDDCPLPESSPEGEVWVGGWMVADRYLLEKDDA